MVLLERFSRLLWILVVAGATFVGVIDVLPLAAAAPLLVVLLVGGNFLWDRWKSGSDSQLRIDAYDRGRAQGRADLEAEQHERLTV